jgi:hypothetical protein
MLVLLQGGFPLPCRLRIIFDLKMVWHIVYIRGHKARQSVQIRFPEYAVSRAQDQQEKKDYSIQEDGILDAGGEPLRNVYVYFC